MSSYYFHRFNDKQRKWHKLRHSVQTVLLFVVMLTLLSLSAWVILGQMAVFLALTTVALMLIVSIKISPAFVLQLHRAREITEFDSPRLHEMLNTLVKQAKLNMKPRLFYIPNNSMNAFTVGTKDSAVIALTDGIINKLNIRELSGVVAHEISHIKNNDLWMMMIASTISSLTNFMTMAGFFLIVISLPILLLNGTFPWLTVLILLAVPTIVSLLQLALSRTREYEADIDAAGYTKDPLGLASALEKIERTRSTFWNIFFPSNPLPGSSMLSTHPVTKERIQRLLSLYEQVEFPLHSQTRFERPIHFINL